MWGGITIVEPPQGEPISQEEARRQCRYMPNDTSRDADLDQYIAGARGWIENHCGILLRPQTASFTATAWSDLGRLPIAPIRSIAAVSSQRLGDAAAAYVDFVPSLAGRYPSLASSLPNGWPLLWPGMVITVTAEVGFTALPGDLKLAMLALIAAMNENRGVMPLDTLAAAKGWVSPWKRRKL